MGGGLVLDANGNRFANELGRRDYVTGEMWKNKPPFRLALNKAASDEIIWHCKHYTGRGVMKFYETGADLAKDMGVPVSKMEAAHEAHYQASQKAAKDPEGGAWPAYPSGKSWDEPSGKTGSGKKFYHNVIPGSAFASQPFYVAIITPVIHYCMGGLETDVNAAVIGKNGPVAGLYVAGECAGGVHGNNRLGGNSLLDCVVFGRVAGKHCAKYMLGANMKDVDVKKLAALPPRKAPAPEPAAAGGAAATYAAPAAGAGPVQWPHPPCTQVVVDVPLSKPLLDDGKHPAAHPYADRPEHNLSWICLKTGEARTKKLAASLVLASFAISSFVITNYVHTA